MEQEFVQRLSPASRYQRFMGTIFELTPALLVRFTQIDYSREMAFVAVREVDGHEIQIGVARYITNPDGDSCEFVVTVADDWQRRGIGRKLMSLLIQAARGLQNHDRRSAYLQSPDARAEQTTWVRDATRGRRWQRKTRAPAAGDGSEQTGRAINSQKFSAKQHREEIMSAPETRVRSCSGCRRRVCAVMPLRC
jgi:GNAT superfamily N-acetyltransferase